MVDKRSDHEMNDEILTGKMNTNARNRQITSSYKLKVERNREWMTSTQMSSCIFGEVTLRPHPSRIMRY